MGTRIQINGKDIDVGGGGRITVNNKGGIVIEGKNPRIVPSANSLLPFSVIGTLRPFSNQPDGTKSSFAVLSPMQGIKLSLRDYADPKNTFRKMFDHFLEGHMRQILGRFGKMLRVATHELDVIGIVFPKDLTPFLEFLWHPLVSSKLHATVACLFRDYNPTREDLSNYQKFCYLALAYMIERGYATITDKDDLSIWKKWSQYLGAPSQLYRWDRDNTVREILFDAKRYRLDIPKILRQRFQIK